MCPGWGTRVCAQSIPHPLATTPPTHPGLRLLPNKWSLSPSLSGCLDFKAQFAVPPQPCSCPHLLFMCLYQLCLPGELQSVSGSNPHLTASQGLLRASMRIRKSTPSSGQTQFCARPLKTWGRSWGWLSVPSFPPEAQHLGTLGPISKIPILPLALPIWSVSRSVPIPPPSWLLGQRPKLNCHPTTYPCDIPPQNLSLSTHTILKPQSPPPWSTISPSLLGQLLFILQNPNLDTSSSVNFPSYPLLPAKLVTPTPGLC